MRMALMKPRPLVVLLFLLLTLTSCSKTPPLQPQPLSTATGQIYLYGEQHGVKEIIDEELRIWGEYYLNENMRHLFIEYPYYTAELLNIGMQSESDEIIESIYGDWQGTMAQNPNILEFFKQIKRDYPDIIFHGTDVGHQYTTGTRYLAYLVNDGLLNSEQYKRTLEIIDQGNHYNRSYDNEYRESKLVENFIREFDALGGENVMGIYGSAHIDQSTLDAYMGGVTCMATQLSEHYGDVINSTDLRFSA